MNDILMMRRALQLAKCGEGRVSPNPMVGAVITAREGIIGEGYHRHWGGPHAEVNAVNSVSEHDRYLLREATMYVTLEPCSHYGKTPPCSELIIRMGIPRVVVATLDPFEKVSGRGVAMLREAGIDVSTGLLGEESRALNRRFITAHTLKRPYITLKWAQTADGYTAGTPGGGRLIISNHLSTVWMHAERSRNDAIFVGTTTVATDNPRLDCRRAPGRLPVAASFASAIRYEKAHIMDGRRVVLREKDEPLPDFLHRLYDIEGITSIMVEGGARTLQEYINLDLYDEVRIETADFKTGKGIASPDIDLARLNEISNFDCNGNKIRIYQQ
ncbi:MAG: bifunctional diaminohydroxyphosphoribosylaminopyrimidine deaminase/5-amino-6-(5-phosphoribosylamino)uracil reductase RibD [Muribaculaceae bacterium]|nr:bifunctional diaminohydroxyphosphoribosylaminopyrimidine deaminase/5-amino-6-(5-phosphoribosylamino)uracil reductase RibD [Muribaculaceae bacterium]